MLIGVSSQRFWGCTTKLSASFVERARGAIVREWHSFLQILDFHSFEATMTSVSRSSSFSSSSSGSISRRLKDNTNRDDDVSEVSAENPIVTQAQHLESLFDHGLDDLRSLENTNRDEDDDLESELGKLARSEEMLRNELEVFNTGYFIPERESDAVSPFPGRSEVFADLSMAYSSSSVGDESSPLQGFVNNSLDYQLPTTLVMKNSTRFGHSPPIILPRPRSPKPPGLSPQQSQMPPLLPTQMPSVRVIPHQDPTYPPARAPSRGELKPPPPHSQQLTPSVFNFASDVTKPHPSLVSDMPGDERRYYKDHEQTDRPYDRDSGYSSASVFPYGPANPFDVRNKTYKTPSSNIATTKDEGHFHGKPVVLPPPIETSSMKKAYDFTPLEQDENVMQGVDGNLLRIDLQPAEKDLDSQPLLIKKEAQQVSSKVVDTSVGVEKNEVSCDEGLVLFSDDEDTADHDKWFAKNSTLAVGPTCDMSEDESSVSRGLLLFFLCCRGRIPIGILLCCMIIGAPIAVSTGVVINNRGDNFLPVLSSFSPSVAPTYVPSIFLSSISNTPTLSTPPSSSAIPSMRPSLRPPTQESPGTPTGPPSFTGMETLMPSSSSSPNTSHLSTVPSSELITILPSDQPTAAPYTPSPSISLRSTNPSSVPSATLAPEPSLTESERPSVDPTTEASPELSTTPSENPLSVSSAHPSSFPSRISSVEPSSVFSTYPTDLPSELPTKANSVLPTSSSSFEPTTSSTTTIALFDFLVSVSPDNGEALMDTGSPQHMAYIWLSGNQDIEKYTEERIIQRYAMAVLYVSTDGNNWVQNSGWLSDTNECTWFAKGGNICGRGNEVRRIEINYNDLDGTIPAELMLLPRLEEVNLGGGPSKRLDGQLPPEFGSLSLREFRVPDNNLTGSIPDSYREWNRLQWFDIANNAIEGEMLIGSWGSLKILNVGNNRLSGVIPEAIASLRDLERLDASFNQLSGEIPAKIEDLHRHLRILNLSHNRLSSLPSNIGKLERLERLFLDNNRLGGSIPNEIGNLGRLRDLTLAFNEFSGSIPTSLAFLGELREILDLGSNNLSGSIPSEIGNINGRVRHLHLSNNRLTGEIPASFAEFQSLVELRVESNNLSGVHPEVCMAYNNTRPLFYADCSVDCPCCTHCCENGQCECLYLGTNQEWLCY